MTTAKGNADSPYSVVERIWNASSANASSMGLSGAFLTRTLGGLIHSLLLASQSARVRAGILHVPELLQRETPWWPFDSEAPKADIMAAGVKSNGHWIGKRLSISPRTKLRRDLWMVWEGDLGSLLLVARKSASLKPGSTSSLALWEVLLTWNPKTVAEASGAMTELWKSSRTLLNASLELQDLLAARSRKRRSADRLGPILRPMISLANAYDPWVQKQITKSSWTSLIHRIQEAIAWELRVEQLLPAIGQVLRRTLGYDFIEIHIFSRVGKRYEEFLAWRRNFTGFGGDQMSLLVNESVVAEILRKRRPRLIRTIREDGLMNPHLAELAHLRQGLIVPLVHRRDVEGLLMLYYRRPTGFNEQDLENIGLIGSSLARSIENSNAHERVQKMATIDGLTGLLNRRSFNDQMNIELKRAKRYDTTFSLIMIDIDNFKHYNDTSGHFAGDKLLKTFAEVVRNSVRGEDIVARYGGEEFAVILPHTDSGRGLIAADKIRQSVYDHDFPHGEKQPLGRVSISLGVADNTHEVRSSQHIINHADSALYRAKEAGRNRAFEYDPKVDSPS